MSKENWILTIRTSLPRVAKNKGEFLTTAVCFESFEDAKKSLREKLKEFAFTKNSMFDGKGTIKYLHHYANLSEVDEELKDIPECLYNQKLYDLEEALLHIFEGKDEPLKLKRIKTCTDYLIAIDITKDSVKVYGYDDGPCNGYDPVIKTNMFDMKKENNYYLYIDDLFGQENYSSELYIDLIKSE